LFTYMVILAGSIVRATQSGMGCPDWPTCFGNIIPPTETWQVQFQPDHTYKKGQFIIYNDSLKYARRSFTSGSQLSEADWQQYEKHNYTQFNVVQSWIEYLNRLATGVFGFVILGHIIWSYRLFRKTRPGIFYWSLSILLLTLFEAWLGKLVVDTELHVVKVTLHMLFALLIGVVAVVILRKTSQTPRVADQPLKWLANAGLAAIFIQVVIGTDIREQIDEIAKAFAYSYRELWIAKIDQALTVHQALAGLVSLLVIALFWLSQRHTALRKSGAGLFIMLLATVAAGLILLNLSMPAAVQPVHLLLSSVLLISLFSFRMRLK
jgi:cytochrome c oxidase assembly protein subunit 15